MKRFSALFLSLAVTVALLTGCGSETGADKETSAKKSDTLKTGIGVVSSMAKSTDAGAKDGLAEVDTTVAAVAVDKDGKIVKCIIDSVQPKINFNASGKITTDLKSTFESKQVLGEAYGMKKASKIGKEWNEEADAFADYCVGKTLDEIKGIAVTDAGIAADTELAASVTVHVGDFITVVSEAVANAKDYGAASADTMGLGLQTNIAKSSDAGDTDGVAQGYTNYVLATFNASGRITSCYIDASQANVNFSKAGKITSDLNADVVTKNELGEAYGMKKASKIGKEWNEQAAAFADYCTGKTLDQVKGIAVDQAGVPTDAELTSSVTVHVGDFTAALEKASESAK